MAVAMVIWVGVTTAADVCANEPRVFGTATLWCADVAEHTEWPVGLAIEGGAIFLQAALFYV
jgi:hypothetical protein